MANHTKLLLVLIAATAPASLPAAASAKPATLHLTAIVYDVHDSNGVFSSKEKLSEGTTHVGEDSSRCTKASKGTLHCVGSYELTHGTLQFSGTIPAAENTNRLAITGGTGVYKGVRGTVLTEYNKPGTRAKETITFK
jgi:hypothetical protein